MGTSIPQDHTVPTGQSTRAGAVPCILSHDVDKMGLYSTAQALPILIHLSLFFFFAGLLIYLFNINLTVFHAVVSWIVVSATAYITITIMPIFRLDSPYYTPISFPVCRACAGVLYTIFQILAFFGSDRFSHLHRYYRAWTFQGMTTILTKTLLEKSPQFDSHIMQWTFDRLIEDPDLARFFQCILGFLSSKVVDYPRDILHRLDGFPQALMGLLHRAWSSNLISESEKLQRLVICVKVVDAAHLLDTAWSILGDIVYAGKYGVLQSIEAGHSLTRQGDKGDQEIGFCAQLVVTGVIANVRERDDRWIALAADHLGDALPHSPKDNYGSVLLVNLIHATRQVFSLNLDAPDSTIRSILESLSKFDIQQTPPELQHDFCVLWNEIVQEARDRGANSLPAHILNCVHHIFNVLHQSPNAAPTAFSASTNDRDDTLPVGDRLSYPSCNLPDHRSFAHGRDETTGGTTNPVPSSSSSIPPVAPPASSQM
jgi:Family of unknown function (DUF6535)